MNIDIANFQRVISELENKGIIFSVDDAFYLVNEDVPEFLNDPELFVARMLDIGKDDYIAFKNMVPLRCTAITRRGNRCKHFVSGGGGQVDIKTYAKLRGGYCGIHGE